MMVGDFDILCAVLPAKTHAILIVDANGMLPIPLALQVHSFFESRVLVRAS
jgi:hypothetical protein